MIEKNNNVAVQREMPWLALIENARLVDDSIVTGWKTYREAVIWCWANRPARGKSDPDDQAMFARLVGMHAPHMSRCVNPMTPAPMDLKPDFLDEFEAYTGWRGVSQWLHRKAPLSISKKERVKRAFDGVRTRIGGLK